MRLKSNINIIFKEIKNLEFELSSDQLKNKKDINIKKNNNNLILIELYLDSLTNIFFALKTKNIFDKFSYTKCHYWIESSLISYLRLLVIGVMKDEYYKNDNDYDDIQTLIKEKLQKHMCFHTYTKAQYLVLSRNSSS